MASRYYDRELKCGCLVSSDGGGGLIPCHYGYGCGKEGCDENHQCDDWQIKDFPYALYERTGHYVYNEVMCRVFEFKLKAIYGKGTNEIF